MTQEWQTMDSAPRDDGCLLLYKPNSRHSGASIFSGYWVQTDNHNTLIGGWMPVAGSYVHQDVTHWQPLPAPPSQEQKK